MAITQDDFGKIWASTSSVPEYTFSDSDYQDGWEFVGNLPPTRAMWDTLQRRNDQKMKYLQDNGSMCVDSVADMVASNLESGQTVITKGYFSVNDGGSALYTIRAKTPSDIDDGGSIIFLDNGNVAECINQPMTTAMFGKVEGDAIDDILALNIPIVLSFDHTIADNGNSIDNVFFNGHYLTGTIGSYGQYVTLSTDKKGIQLKELTLSISNASNINISYLKIERLNYGGFMVSLKNVDHINIDNFILNGIYLAGVVTNTDGIHIANGGHDINISNGLMSCGDDAFGFCANDKYASLSGDIYNVNVSNVVMSDTNYSAVRLLAQVNNIHDIVFSNCVLIGIYGTYKAKSVVSEYGSDCDYDGIPYSARVYNITFDNCAIHNNSDTTSESDNNKPILDYITENITFHNCKIEVKHSAQLPIRFANQKSIIIDGMTYNAKNVVTLQNLNIIRTDTVEDVSIKNFKTKIEQKSSLLQQLTSANNISVENVTFDAPCDRFVYLNNCKKFIGINISFRSTFTGYPVSVESGTTDVSLYGVQYYIAWYEGSITEFGQHDGEIVGNNSCTITQQTCIRCKTNEVLINVIIKAPPASTIAPGTTIATIPTRFRPKQNMNIPCIINNATVGIALVGAGGAIITRSTLNANEIFELNMMYIIGNL